MADSSRPDNPNVRLPPPLIYAAGIALGAWFEHRHRLFDYPQRPSHIVAVGALLVGVAIAVSAMAMFRQARTSILPIRPANALVTTGVYRLTRNPMYLSLAVLYVGITLWFTLSWSIMFFPLVIVLVQFCVIRPEERYLRRQFGQSYIDYQTRVRRWL